MNKAFGKSIATKSLWTEEWPIINGLYWFYGRLTDINVDRAPKLFVVQVRKIANGYMYLTEGQFLFKEEGAKGIWKFLPEPKLPKDKDKLFAPK